MLLSLTVEMCLLSSRGFFLYQRPDGITSCDGDITCTNGCCSNNPCLNGGTCNEICEPTSVRYNCSCSVPYVGKHCENVREIFQTWKNWILLNLVERFSLERWKVICFVLTTPHDWLDSFNQSEIKLVPTRFPVLCVSYMLLLGVLTGFLCCLFPSWFV